MKYSCTQRIIWLKIGSDRVGYCIASRQPFEWNYFPLLIGRIILSNKKRNLRKYSVVIFKAFSKKKVFGGPCIYINYLWLIYYVLNLFAHILNSFLYCSFCCVFKIVYIIQNCLVPSRLFVHNIFDIYSSFLHTVLQWLLILLLLISFSYSYSFSNTFSLFLCTSLRIFFYHHIHAVQILVIYAILHLDSAPSHPSAEKMILRTKAFKSTKCSTWFRQWIRMPMGC